MYWCLHCARSRCGRLTSGYYASLPGLHQQMQSNGRQGGMPGVDSPPLGARPGTRLILLALHTGTGMGDLRLGRSTPCMAMSARPAQQSVSEIFVAGGRASSTFDVGHQPSVGPGGAAGGRSQRFKLPRLWNPQVSATLAFAACLYIGMSAGILLDTALEHVCKPDLTSSANCCCTCRQIDWFFVPILK